MFPLRDIFQLRQRITAILYEYYVEHTVHTTKYSVISTMKCARACDYDMCYILGDLCAVELAYIQPYAHFFMKFFPVVFLGNASYFYP